MLDIVNWDTGSDRGGHAPELLRGASLESYLASSGVPMDDVGVQLGLEPLERVELSAAVELVLQVAEDLLGRRVVQAVALAAHGLADAGAFELVPPPLVLVLPSHVRVQDRLRAGGQALREHGGQALLLPEVRTAAHVPGDDLLAGHVVHGSEVRLGAGDLELGDVGAEPGERTGRVEVAFGQVMHAVARLAPVRAVPPPRVPGADGASQPIRRMTPSTVLADMRVPNSWTRHMRTCRWPHPFGVRSHISRTIGSTSGLDTCAGRDR